MKIHALTVCLTSVLVAGAAAAQADNDKTRDSRGAASKRDSRGSERSGAAMRGDDNRTRRDNMQGDRSRGDRMRGDRMRGDRMRGDTNYNNYWDRPGNRDRDPNFLRFTPAPDLRTEAGKVADLVTMNRMEAMDLRSMGDKARTAGWENIQTMYLAMVPDHERAVSMGEGWLSAYHFNLRTEMPASMTASNISPEGSVDAMLQHHEMVFNDSLTKAHNEESPAVRGMLLMNAATANRHASALRWLNHHVDMGHKAMTADLAGFVGSQVAGSRQSTDPSNPSK